MNLILHHQKCSGCGACKLACSIANFLLIAPSRALLRIEGRFPSPGDYHIHVCDQCGACAEACPVDAIVLEDGVFRINEADCIACHDCVKACPRNVMIIQPETGIPAKCILCGECVLACPREAIFFSCEDIAKECQ